METQRTQNRQSTLKKEQQSWNDSKTDFKTSDKPKTIKIMWNWVKANK